MSCVAPLHILQPLQPADREGMVALVRRLIRVVARVYRAVEKGTIIDLCWIQSKGPNGSTPCLKDPQFFEL